MRHLLRTAVLVLTILAPSLAHALPVSVQATWAANPSGDGVTSYKVYYGTGASCGPGLSSVFGQVSAPTVTYTGTIDINAPTNYLFCVTALDVAGNEGQASVAVTKLINPFWSESFEDTALPHWTQTPSGLNGAIVVSSTDKTDGVRSLKSTFADLTRATGPYLDRATPTVSELYTRFFVRASPGFTWGSPYTTIGSFGAGTTAPIISLVNTTAGTPYVQAQTVKEAGYGSESFLQNQGTAATISSSWVCFETRVRYNTPGVANGIIQYWMDNVLKGDYQNREFLGSATSDLAPSTAQQSYVRLYNDRGTGDLYLDQLQISNQRLGCTGSTPPASTTVIAPTNLRFATAVTADPIAIDVEASSSLATTTNTTNWPITIGSGSSRGLLVAHFAGDGTATNCYASSIALGAQALTLLRRDAYPTSGSVTEWWGLAAPMSGAGTITTTTAASCFFFRDHAIALTNVSQSAMLGADNGTLDQGSPSTISTSLTNLIDGAWIFDAVETANGDGLTVGSGQTQRFNVSFSVGGFDQTIAASSIGPLPTSTVRAMEWTHNPPAAQRDYVQTVVSIHPVASGGSTSLVEWTDNSSDETGFVGEWKHDGTGGVYVPLFTVGPNVTSYPNPITTQTNACIRVKAVRNSDVSDWTTTLLCGVPPTETPPDPGDPIVVPPSTTPPPPTTVTPAPTVSGKLQNGLTILSWPSLNTADSTKSKAIVEWATYKTGTNVWAPVGTSAEGATGFVHRYTPFVPAGESEAWVCYRVKFSNGAGTTAYSPQACHDVDVFVPLSTPSVQMPAAPTALYLQ